MIMAAEATDPGMITAATVLSGGTVTMIMMTTTHLLGGMMTMIHHGGAVMMTIPGAMTAVGTATGETTGAIGTPAVLTGIVIGDR